MAGAHGAWHDMQLQTDNSGSVMFEPCVPPGTERINILPGSLQILLKALCFAKWENLPTLAVLVDAGNAYIVVAFSYPDRI